MKYKLWGGVGVLVLSAAVADVGFDPATLVLAAVRQTPPAPPTQEQIASQPAGQTQPPAEDRPEDQGFPVTSKLVIDNCGGCHQTDAKNVMTRISFRRSTPEGWQEAIRRMVALNDVTLKPEDAREIVKYLANNHGLAPEELQPATFEVERRLVDYKYGADRDTETTCTKCHSFGRVLTERRSKEDWELLLAMHRGFYPLIDNQAFRRTGGRQSQPGPDGRPPDDRHPMDRALAHLTTAFPLRTPEWATWSANMRPPRLEGRWMIGGYQPGKGEVFGEMVVTRAPEAADEFFTETRLTVARTGESATRKGRAIVYTGFQWRGRSADVAASADGAFREVMAVDRDWQRMTGRWFSGGYDELGIDVTLDRLGRDPITLSVNPTALKSGVNAETVRIYGANFPASVAPADIDFGQGVKVSRVVSATPALLTVEVSVAQDATVGTRDVFVSGGSRAKALSVYDKIDGIKVVPQWGMARTGGPVFPKQLAQFEAVAYHNGADGKPDTPDDVNLGLVDASWSLEEYTAIFGDDDLQFIGTIGDTGLFTPNGDGPNPKRRNNANNIGDVYVVATYLPPGAAKTDRPFRARAHLLVTVPLYLRFDAWPVGSDEGRRPQ